MLGGAPIGAKGAPVPTGATKAVLESTPGLRAMVQGDGLAGLYGAPLATNDTSAAGAFATTDAFVEDFMSSPETRSAFGVDGALFQAIGDTATATATGKHKVYAYQQILPDAQQGDLPIHGAGVKLAVRLGQVEKIAYAGVRVVGHPENPLAADLVTANDATTAVANSPAYLHLAGFTAPEKVVYAADDRALHRAWRLEGYDDDEAYRFFVDTNTGQIVGVENLVYNETLSGTVYGYATPCLPPDHPSCPNCCPADNPANPESCPQLTEMPEIEVTAGGQQTNAALEDATYSFELAPELVTVETHAVGTWVTVQNLAGENGSHSRNTTPPQTGFNLWLNGTGGSCTFQEEAEFSTAQVNAYFGVEESHKWFAALAGGPTAIDQNLLANVNRDSTCNAFYNPLPTPSVTFFRSGGGCNNTASVTVVAHEYGHFIVDQITVPIGIVQGSFHEGAADVVGSFVWNTPVMGYDFCGQPIRHLDTPDVRLNECLDEEPDWCVGCSCGEIHCDGLALAGAFWDLRKRLITRYGESEGIAKVDQLFADFLFISDGVLDETVVVEVLVADDDNGELTDRTENWDDIIASFVGTGVDQHGWSRPLPAYGRCVGGNNAGDGCACPGGQCVSGTCAGGARDLKLCDVNLVCDGGTCEDTVDVRWLPPVGSPQSGVDYTVHYEVTPASVEYLFTVYPAPKSAIPGEKRGSEPEIGRRRYGS